MAKTLTHTLISSLRNGQPRERKITASTFCCSLEVFRVHAVVLIMVVVVVVVVVPVLPCFVIVFRTAFAQKQTEHPDTD